MLCETIQTFKKGEFIKFILGHKALHVGHTLSILYFLDWFNVCLPDLEQKNASLKEKQHAISETISEIQQKEMQKNDIVQKIEKLKEEQAKRKECKFIFEN